MNRIRRQKSPRPAVGRTMPMLVCALGLAAVLGVTPLATAGTTALGGTTAPMPGTPGGTGFTWG